MSEAKRQTSRIPKIVLVGIRKLVRESGQQIIDFRRPERDRLAQRAVDAATKRHRKCILCRGCFERTSPGDRLANLPEGIGINVAVCCAEKEMRERVYSLCGNFELRPEHVRKQITGDLAARASRKG